MEDEVSFTNKYSLIATINHSGALNRGHYWAFIKDLHSSCWCSCNDRAAFNVGKFGQQYYIIHPFLKQSLKFSQDFHKFVRGFCRFRHCLWVRRPHV